MQASKKDCTIIILSHNNEDIIDNCLTQVESAVSESEKKFQNNFQVMVVDNGSTDKTKSIIQNQHKSLKLISLDNNIGPSKANNLAMKKADTQYILLLNSDTFLTKDTLIKIFDYIQKQNDWDVLCVRLIFGDGSFQAFGGFLPTPTRTILWSLGVESLPIINKLIRPFYQYDREFYQKEQRLGWCATSFFFLKQKVYLDTGGLDESIFVHMEDVEWCQRIKSKGYIIRYTPEITVTHLGGKTTNKFSSDTLLSQHISGLKIFHLKHYRKTWFIVRFFLQIGMGLRAVAYFIFGRLEKSRVYQKAIMSI
jgi:GT2 family glycosyltransferase